MACQWASARVGANPFIGPATLNPLFFAQKQTENGKADAGCPLQVQTNAPDIAVHKLEEMQESLRGEALHSPIQCRVRYGSLVPQE